MYEEPVPREIVREERVIERTVPLRSAPHEGKDRYMELLPGEVCVFIAVGVQQCLTVFPL